MNIQRAAVCSFVWEIRIYVPKVNRHYLANLSGTDVRNELKSHSAFTESSAASQED